MDGWMENLENTQSQNKTSSVVQKLESLPGGCRCFSVCLKLLCSCNESIFELTWENAFIAAGPAVQEKKPSLILERKFGLDQHWMRPLSFQYNWVTVENRILKISFVSQVSEKCLPRILIYHSENPAIYAHSEKQQPGIFNNVSQLFPLPFFDMV